APDGAVAAFTRSLALTAGDESGTFRASLYALRAEAQRRLGRSAEAEDDVRNALSELRAEESRILEHRQTGQGEQLWSAYFSRFRDTYHLLIRQLIEEHRLNEAFDYAERARAFEPLDLIGKLDVAPQIFRD